MNKKTIIEIIIIIALVVILGIIIGLFIKGNNSQSSNGNMSSSKIGTPPNKPDGNGGQHGGNSGSSNVAHTGATEISSDTTNNGESYSSTTGSENALLITGGISTLTNPTVNKTGDSDGDNSDFYGTNAAILAKEGTLNINGGEVTTNGSHANGVFAFSNGTINISDTKIKTTSNNSGALMVTGGGTLTANNVTAETDGNSSAPIRSDRGGGTLTVKC